MKPSKTLLRNLKTSAILSIIFSFQACGFYGALRIGEEKGFIHMRPPGSLGVSSEDFPFMYVWSDFDYNLHRETVKEEGYYNLYIAPIAGDYLELSTMEEWFQDEIQELHSYFRQTLEEEIEKNQAGSIRVHLTHNRDEADYAFECQITEINFGTPIVYVGTWLLPIPGIATAVDATTTPLIAFEAKFVDVKYNKVVAEIYDRKIPKVRILDLRKAVSMTSPIREVMRDWSIELARTFSFRSDIDDDIEATDRFSLLPW